MCDTRLIEWQEGFRAEGYDDANGHDLPSGYTIVGNVTVGFGFNIGPGGGGLSEIECRLVLNYRIGKLTSKLSGLYPWYGGLDTVRKQALLSMAYNMGVPRFAGFKKMIKAFEAGNLAEAANQVRDSLYYRNTATHNRASQIADMIETGDWPEGFPNT